MLQRVYRALAGRHGEGLPFESVISDWAKLGIQGGIVGACGLRSGEDADAQRGYRILTPVLCASVLE